MTAELAAAGIIACAAITLAALSVAHLAHRSGRQGRWMVDPHQLQRHANDHGWRLADLEDRVRALESPPAAPVAVPTPPQRPVTGDHSQTAPRGRHEAHRARFYDLATRTTDIDCTGGDTLRARPTVLGGGWRPGGATSVSPNDLGEWLATARRDQAAIDRSPWANIDYDDAEPGGAA